MRGRSKNKREIIQARVVGSFFMYHKRQMSKVKHFKKEIELRI